MFSMFVNVDKGEVMERSNAMLLMIMQCVGGALLALMLGLVSPAMSADNIFTNNVGISSAVPQQKLDVEGNAYFGTGNVGIGSAIPAQKLDVNGIIYSHSNVGIGSAVPGALLQVGTNPSITTGSSPTAAIKGNLMIDGNVYASSGNKFIGDGSGLTGITGGSQWSGTAGSAIYYNSANVGIGSAVPQQKLDVEGTAYFGAGNVGIGSAVPQANLDVKGNAVFAASYTAVPAWTITKGLTQTSTNIPAATDFSGVAAIVGKAVAGNPYAFRTYGVEGIAATNEGFDAQDFSILSTFIGVQGTILLGNQGKTVGMAASFYSAAALVGSGNTLTNYYGIYLDSIAGSTVINNYGIYQVDTNARNFLAGNVGIGSTAPQQKLDVEGNAYFGTGNVGIGTATTSALLDVNGVIYSRGNVGIGTSVPRQKLDVDGSVYMKGYVGIGSVTPQAALDMGSGGIRLGGVTQTSWPSGSSQWSGTAGSAIYYNSANVGIGSAVPQQKLDVEGNAYFGTGNVGIGTAVPAQKLDVNGNIYSRNNVGIGTSVPRQKLDVDGTVYAKGNLGINTLTPAATLDVNGTIYSHGNIGIGTTTPYEQLHVGGISGDRTILVGVADAGYDSYLKLMEYTAGPEYGGMIKHDGTINDLVIGTIENGTEYPAIFIERAATRVEITNSLAVSSALGGNGDLFTVLSSSNIGIGSVTPQQKLDVEGNAYFGTGNVGIGTAIPAQKLDVNGVIYSRGNVGIGTSVPRQKLDVDGSVYMKGYVGIGSVTPQAALDMGSGGIRLGGVTQTSWPSGSSQWSGTAGSAIYYNSANVGIGSAVPQQKLDVEGNAYFGTGNVGVGTAVPAQKLDVNGTIYAHVNVGIGTAVPEAMLSLTSSFNTGISKQNYIFLRDGGGNTGYIGMDQTGSENGMHLGSSGPIAFYTGGNQTFRLNADGSGGGSIVSSNYIRTYQNQSSGYGMYLDVSGGSASQYALRITNENTIPLMAVMASGNVAVGVTDPQQVLDVNGMIYGRSNVGIGSSTPQQILDVNGNIYSRNNVGIGTSVPRQKLDVDGTVYAKGNLGINTLTPAATLDVNGTIYSHGNVGIGTSVPRQKLDVDGSVYMKGYVGIGSVTPQAALDMGTGGIRLGGVTNTTWPSGSSQWSGTAGSAIYYNSANVGIGSAAPQQALDVEGNAYFGTGNVGIGTAVPAQKLDVNGVIYSRGNVGIGTSTPAAMLSIFGTANSARFAYDASIYATLSTNSSGDLQVVSSSVTDSSLTVGSNGAADAAVILDNATSDYYLGIDNSDSSKLLIGLGQTVGTTPYITVTAAGSVGISDTTPDHLLDVGGNFGLSASAYLNFGDTDGTSGYGLRDNGGTIQYKNSGGSWADIGSGGASQWSGTTGSAIYYNLANVGIGTSAPVAMLDIRGAAHVGDGTNYFSIDADGDFTGTGTADYLVAGNRYAFRYSADENYGIYFNTAGTGSIDFLGGAAALMHQFDAGTGRVYHSGNVGIGSAVPRAKLEVEGSVYFGTGNVGIGTSAPGALFQAVSGSNSYTFFNGSASATPYVLVSRPSEHAIAIATGASASGVIFDDAGSLIFATDPKATMDGGTGGGTTVLMTLLAGGNLGIGSTAPTRTLDVNGAVYSHGNVGIGTSVPRQKLDVDGSVYMKGYVGISTITPNSILQVSGSFAVYRVGRSASVTSAGETIIGVTSTAANYTITLATADMKAGRIMIVKDESGAAASHNITVDTQGTEKIDGQDSIAITANYGVLRVYSNGSNWYTF